jgi:hypothetical protein
LPDIKTIVIVGSGVVEPMTVAALPGLEKSRVYAIELNDDLIDLGEQIKNGATIPWLTIAEFSHNPGRPNNDLKELARLQKGLGVLRDLGSLDRLGTGFNTTSMHVDKSVADRVTFLQGDALETTQAINQQGITPDLVIDCFLRTNVLKTNSGTTYTKQLTNAVLDALAEDGMYLIGDTGESLPDTLSSFVGNTSGNVNFGSLVHVVQIRDGAFITSHHTAASKMEDLNSQKLKKQARLHIAKRPDLYRGHTVDDIVLPDLQRELAGNDSPVSLALVKNSKTGLKAWNMPRNGLYASAPAVGDEFSHKIIFSPQK